MTAIVRPAGRRPTAALEGYRDVHRGADVVVCGCGTSLTTLADPARYVTIGVNDVGRLFDPTYLVVVNPPDQLGDGRFEFVKGSGARALFTQLDLGPVRPPVVHFRLGRFGGTDTTSGAVLHYTQNSPYVAVCLAALMGARRIGLIGVDLTDDHFFARTGSHALSARLHEIDAQYARLAAALASRGVELVNLSPISRLSALPRARIAKGGAWVGAGEAPAAPSRARRVFFVNYRFLSCGDVFREGLRHGAEELGVESADADWDDAHLPAKVHRFDPDLLFVVHGRKFARRWRRTFAGRRTAVWLLDEPYEVDDTAAFSPLFTHVFVNDPTTLDRHRNAHYLPVCYDPRVHAPGTGERAHRVGFVGGGNAAREKMLAALARRGLLDYVVGGPWKDAALRRLCRTGNVPAAETAALYRATRIVVNVFRDVHHYDRRRTPAVSLNPRVYEALACGALVVSERRPEVARLVPELPTFEGPEELAALIDGLLARPDEAEAIRAACAARVKDATYGERLRTVLSLVADAPAPAAAVAAAPPAAPFGGAWDLLGPVEARDEDGVLVLRKAPDGRPATERGLASRASFAAVDLSFDVLVTPGSAFIAKVHQQDRVDQASNSYHLFVDGSRSYLARHDLVLSRVALEAGRWQRVRLTCGAGTVSLSCNDRPVCRVDDGHLQGGYAFLGLKGGEVRLRNVTVARSAPPARPAAGLLPAPAARADHPRVSIVTTVYDRTDCLRRCLRSVKELTFRDYEHIVVSDHPPEAVREEIARIVGEENDGRISYYDLQARFNNWGIAPAAAGLRRSRGDFVCFLSDDNGYRPDHLDLLVGALDRDPHLGFAYSSCLYGGGMVLRDPRPRLGAIDLGQPLFRRELFTRHLGDDLPFDVIHWDWELIRHFMRRGERWKHVDQPSFVFRLAAYPRLLPGASRDGLGERLERLYRTFAPQQRWHEYLSVAERVRTRLGPLQASIEVGSSAGGTLALWAELSGPRGVCVAVDVPQGPGARFGDEALRRAAGGRPLALVRSDSRLAATREAVRQALGARRADLLFLDASHRAPDVRSDLRGYGPFVRDGGLVALHDIVPHARRPDVRVHELWGELRARFARLCEEVVEAPGQDWGGIGLLTMTPEVRAFLAAPDRLPVFINNFNRLTSTRALAEWAAGLPGARVVLLDNHSDWPPLLEWYERCPFEVRRLGANRGHRAPWTSGAVEGVTTPFYVVTDPDLDLSGCPRDLLDVLADGLARYPWAQKAGVSLELEDVPEGYPSRALIQAREAKYWQERLDAHFFNAPVDTTFALYRAGREPACAPALRADRPYVARHLPWYVTPASLTDEERHYLRSADTRFSSGTAHTRTGYGIVVPRGRGLVRAAAAAGGQGRRRR